MYNGGQMRKILPCPFCGDEPSVIDTGVSGIDVINLSCSNEDCFISPETKTNGSLTQAMKAWNNRC